MKRPCRFLCPVLIVFMMLSLCNAVAFATGEEIAVSEDLLTLAVAKIGNTEYSSLQAAVDAAQKGDRIVLVGDIEEDIEETTTVEAGKEITIDLNGRTIVVFDEVAKENLCGIINYGTLTIEDSHAEETGELYQVDNYGELTIESGWTYLLKNNAGAKMMIKGGVFNYFDHVGGSISVTGGLFARVLPLEYVDDAATVAKMDITKTFRPPYGVLWVFYYAVNDSIALFERDMGAAEGADEGKCNFDLVKIPQGGTKIEIGNFHKDLVINNETTREAVLNGHLVGAEVKGVRLSDLPVYREPTLYAIHVANGTSRIDGVETYQAAEGAQVQLHASGAPDGQAFDKWEITGVDTAGLDLTKGELCFSMPAGDVQATATYREVEKTPEEGNENNEPSGSAGEDVMGKDVSDIDTPQGEEKSFNVLWIVLAAVVVGALIGAIVYKRKQAK